MFSLVKESLLGFIFFFFNDTATTEIYTLSLHDALPIFPALSFTLDAAAPDPRGGGIAIGTISVGLEPTEVISMARTAVAVPPALARRGKPGVRPPGAPPRDPPPPPGRAPPRPPRGPPPAPPRRLRFLS